MTAGIEKQWQFLRKTAELGKIAHAYLFYGQGQAEKKKLALDFIKLINCQSQTKPCQKCRSCQEIEKNISPDLIVVEPEEGEIKIGRVRDIHQKLALRSYAALYKSVIINRAHTLNRDAQSAFLKLLEEPKGKTVFIMLTEYPEMLLPTILSRVERLRIYSLPEKTAATSYQKKTIDELLKNSQQSLARRFDYAKNLADKQEETGEVLSVWLAYFREQLLLAVRGQKGAYSLAKLKKILNSIQNTNLLLSTTNVNPRLALEILMLEL